MAFRADISVDWISSPRIITVASPSTELTIQDLHDTLVTLEALLVNMDNKQIVSSGGKELLDATTRVGITLTLLNAKVGFEARAVWTQCSISGGNLVAVDTNGDPMNPLNPTAFVNIDRTSSSSGTLQEQDALQYSSYQNGVWVDVNSEHTGTAFPSGTREHPVDNVQDAVLIADEKGFDTINVLGSLTLTTGDDVSDMTIKGSNPMTSILTIEPGAITDNVYIKEIYFTGTLDGGSILRDCVLGEIQYFDGYIEHCAFTSNTYYVNGVGIFIDCFAGATCLSDPIIDMTDGDGLGIRSFVGDLTIANKIGITSCQVMINGKLLIEPSCTAGEIRVYGDGYVVNNGTGTFSIVDKTTATEVEIADEVETRVLDTNIVSVTDTAVTNIDDFKADSIPIDTAAIAAAVWGYLNRTLTGDSDVDEIGIADAVWTKYLNDGGIRFTNDHATLITMAKEMLYNKAVVSSDKRIVNIYANNGVDIKYTIDVSADELERTPRA